MSWPNKLHFSCNFEIIQYLLLNLTILNTCLGSKQQIKNRHISISWTHMLRLFSRELSTVKRLPEDFPVLLPFAHYPMSSPREGIKVSPSTHSEELEYPNCWWKRVVAMKTCPLLVTWLENVPPSSLENVPPRFQRKHAFMGATPPKRAYSAPYMWQPN